MTIPNHYAHCGRDTCSCTHTDGCYRGWLDDIPTRDHNGQTYVQTMPCANCRPDAYKRIMDARAARVAAMRGKRS